MTRLIKYRWLETKIFVDSCFPIICIWSDWCSPVQTVPCKLKDNKKSHWRGGRCVSHESTTVHETLTPVLNPTWQRQLMLNPSFSLALSLFPTPLVPRGQNCQRSYVITSTSSGRTPEYTCIQKLFFWIQHVYSEKLHTSVETYKVFKEHRFNYIHKGKSMVGKVSHFCKNSGPDLAVSLMALI
jgi:hypothetical protein